MSNYLAKTPQNFRAEIARHRLAQIDLCKTIGMNTSFLSNLLNEDTRMYEWSANNIAWGINRLVGSKIFETKARLMPASRGRPRLRDLYPLIPEAEEAVARRVPGGF